MNQIEIDKIVAEAEAAVVNTTAKLTAAQAVQETVETAWEKVDNARIAASNKAEEADYAVEKAAARLDKVKAWAASSTAPLNIDRRLLATRANAAAELVKFAAQAVKAVEEAVAAADFEWATPLSWNQKFHARQAVISATDAVHHTNGFAKSVAADKAAAKEE